MVLFIQQIKKIVYIQAILPTKAYISNKSGAIGVQHSSTPLPTPRQHLFTHTHTNKLGLMLRRMCSTYQNYFLIKKNTAVFRTGPLTRPGLPRPGGTWAVAYGEHFLRCAPLRYMLPPTGYIKQMCERAR